MITLPTSVTAAPAHQATATPLPKEPVVPQGVLDLASAPLFRGDYHATERDTWHAGVPLIGRKLTSTRGVAFSNEFNILKSSGPMVGYAGATLDDAVRSAGSLAYDLSDPALGGAIYSSVGVAVLQSKDGAYYQALVGSGRSQTSGSELGYRSDRFDDNIYGNAKRADDVHAISSWTHPVDRHGAPTDVAPPADDSAVVNRHLQDVQIDKFTAASPMLKAIVDVNKVHSID